MTGRMTIPTANVGFSVTPSSKKLTSSDCDNDRQPEMKTDVLGPSLQFLVLVRCRNHLATLLSSSSDRKFRICRWNFDAICHSARGITTSGFGGHIDTSGCRSLLYPLVNTIFHLYRVLNSRFVVRILTVPVIVSEL